MEMEREVEDQKINLSSVLMEIVTKVMKHLKV